MAEPQDGRVRQGPARVRRIGLLTIGMLCAAALAVTVDAIRREALRPNGDPDGRPLPLASRWNAHNHVQGGVVAPGEPAGVHLLPLPARLCAAQPRGGITHEIDPESLIT